MVAGADTVGTCRSKGFASFSRSGVVLFRIVTGIDCFFGFGCIVMLVFVFFATDQGDQRIDQQITK